MSNLIFSNFEPSSSAAWKQKIQFELNGADFNETLLTKTNEGITIKPFYHSDTFEKVNVPISKNKFCICSTIAITNEEYANFKAVNAIKKGFTSLKFEVSKPFNFENLFRNLLNNEIEFQFQLRFLSEEFTNKLIAFLKNETVYINIDIVGNLAKTGNWYTSLNADFKSIENLIEQNATTKILSVNAALYQNAGANTVQQIAYALAHANEYFNKFGGKIVKNMQFNFAIGSNYFFEIAKIRAFRYLLNLILKEYNTEFDIQIFAEQSLRNKTANHNINNLRSINESLSAIYSGANTVTANKFDKELFSETNINDLKIAATDCYYIESITKQIAEKALNIFKEIEKGGGFLNQLKEGTIQRKIVENAKKEQTQFNNGELILVGANKYKNTLETVKLDTFPIIERKNHKTLIIPIIPKRLAEKLEQKKSRNDA
ncbi:methylmalonyl-CoA mutase [Lutibacter sp. HS1-25]|uniref:methylmalonyl-CoA mutase family protein n=1 Tax=Lutibacter sp. HS1-25 TaxID=2485000 RepID=UPI0010122484|nr:methylmalonyl-CoA mutase family protein [Lutibacter sp. HS1-25]RXP56170.1 methylmalonyl-CoA mutase [Lutibacter sp. HS1-25]